MDDNQHAQLLDCYRETACAGGLAASLPELPKAVTSSGNSPFHAVDPNIHDTASSQSAQTPVKPSPFSPGHPHNVPGGHRALDVSDVVSPTPANGSSTAHSGGIAETLVSAAQCDSRQAAAALQRTRCQPIQGSDAVDKHIAAEVWTFAMYRHACQNAYAVMLLNAAGPCNKPVCV